MYKADRVFWERNSTTGRTEWFFLTREGVMGPYESEIFARKSLDEFKDRCALVGNNVHRAADSNSHFELVRDGNGLTIRKMEPEKSS
jgi:hypothetical protein